MMKWEDDEVEYVEIIETSRESFDKYHKKGWGASECVITREQVEELLNGKSIAYCDGEYTYTITLKEFHIGDE